MRTSERLRVVPWKSNFGDACAPPLSAFRSAAACVASSFATLRANAPAVAWIRPELTTSFRIATSLAGPASAGVTCASEVENGQRQSAPAPW
jgi:hypothetical protein